MTTSYDKFVELMQNYGCPAASSLAIIMLITISNYISHIKHRRYTITKLTLRPYYIAFLLNLILLIRLIMLMGMQQYALLNNKEQQFQAFIVNKPEGFAYQIAECIEVLLKGLLQYLDLYFFSTSLYSAQLLLLFTKFQSALTVQTLDVYRQKYLVLEARKVLVERIKHVFIGLVLSFLSLGQVVNIFTLDKLYYNFFLNLLNFGYLLFLVLLIN